MNYIFNKKSLMGYICFVMLCGIIMIGCSANKSIVGTWVDESGEEEKMSFYDDGSCLNTGVRTNTSADPVSFKQQDDGMLIFTMEWDGTIVYERTDDKDQALEDGDYYYLSGDTLIFHETTYSRKK